ncbi:MAG TPA: ATP-dependent sacrificial sulfur transferase LarE [Actinomycetes bacterium]|nr:ATP-dependent sacrificial sulfur transferase LarE [Actinomycetes bacterium]
MPVRPLVVGFDLDMTLIDSRPGIAAVWDALSAETGVAIDSAAAVSRLGPPLDEELALWFPADQVAAMGDRFRALYPSLAVEPTGPLPGAREAVDAVHRHGGRVVVVTAKYEPNARRHLEHLGISADEVVGWRWGPAKGEALLEHGATVYVGDHVADVHGARVAGALSVGVPTGPVPADELAAAGADVVLADLRGFPAWLDEHLLRVRVAALEERLADLGSVLVAFSGGADSAFLLAAAARVLGPRNVAAATAVSGSLPGSELDAAGRFAADLGVRHLAPRTDELARDGYRANAGDRCYFCKAELLDVLGPLAAEHGLAAVATGTNADDARAGFRPGIRAAAERQAVTPLLDAGLTKGQVRAASREWGLPTWDKPAAACLSSRVAFGLEITPARLARVERAEEAARSALREAGIPVVNLRVRDLGETARLEVDNGLVGRVAAAATVVDAVRTAGFPAVEVDPRGFRSGAMNELLAEPERYR